LPQSPLFPYTTLFRSSNSSLGSRRRSSIPRTGASWTSLAPSSEDVRVSSTTWSTMSPPFVPSLEISRKSLVRDQLLEGLAGADRSEEHTSELQSRFDL